MPDIVVNLITPDGTSLTDTQFPDDAGVMEIIADITNQLNLPAVDDKNQPIDYYFETAQGKRLDNNKTMAEAGLEQNATISLKSPSPLPSLQIVEPPPPPPPDGMVEVNIRLLDSNLGVVESFTYDTSVKDVINKLISKHNLPTRDEKFRQGKIYQIWSKTAGAFLLEKLTLRESMIPQRDTFVLSTHETPGARRR